MVLGFDFGMKYIGVASGQNITKTATPLTAIKATDGIPNWDEIAELIKTWQPTDIVVGIPVSMDDSTQQMTFNARKFANRMREKFKLPVHFVDERLSTWEAKNELYSHGKKLSVQAVKDINAKAAALITQQWLNR